MSEDATEALTPKEKETLRLILRGHDAKSSARALDLSVHTVNGRLRDARRKLGVTSSKEAARMLLADEGPEFLAGESLGDASEGGAGSDTDLSNGARPGRRRLIGGLFVMSALTALVALALAGSGITHDPTPPDSSAERIALDHATEAAAREFLADVDAYDWEASYAATGSQFRSRNTLKIWSDASDQVRVPLGAVSSREATGYQEVYAPPNGYRVVTFRTDFSGKPGAVETVTLEREGGAWRVVSYIIE